MFGVASRHARENAEVQELVVKGPSMRNGRGRCWTHDEDLERADPVEGEFGLENCGVGAFLYALANGGSGVVDPCPTVDRERRGNAEGVHDEGVAAVEARYVDSVKVPDGAVGTLLASSGKVDERELAPVEALMSANASRVEDAEGKARQAAHVSGGQPDGGADGVVVGAFDVRGVSVPIVSVVCFGPRGA